MIDHEIKFIATGEFLVGYGVRSVHGTIEEFMKSAKEEIIIAVYTITGNISEFFEMLEKCASKGIKIIMVINKIPEKDIKTINFLKKLKSDYDHVKIYNFIDKSGGDLHVKAISVDRKKAIIGSANLSWKGMVQNHELGVVIEGKHAEKVSKLIENLVSASEEFV